MIQLREQIQIASLPGAAHSRWRIQIKNRTSDRAEWRPLSLRGKITIRPICRAALGICGPRQHYKAQEIFERVLKQRLANIRVQELSL